MSDLPGDGHAGSGRPATFAFRYPPHDNLKWIYACVVIGGAFGGVRWITEDGGDLRVPVLVVLGMAAAFSVAYLLARRVKPDMPDLKWVSVSPERGLEMGRLRLPAERIGEVVEIDRKAATDAMHTPRTLTLLRCRIGERESAPWRVIYPIWHQHAAVWVEDVEAADRRRRWWLLAVPDHVDQGDFADALRTVRPADGVDGAGADASADAADGDDRSEHPGSADPTEPEDL